LSRDFEKFSNAKFHENASSESRVVLSGQAEGWTDMLKLTVAFRNFTNTRKHLYSLARNIIFYSSW